MEKFIKSFLLIVVQILLFNINCYSQNFSKLEIEQLAERINKEAKGKDIGDGVKVLGCFSFGRTLVYKYDVPSDWYPIPNIKQELISNFKTIGAAKPFFLRDINVDFHYYKNGSLIKRVSVKSNEFSTFNYQLGEYFSINDHPKSKGVNLKLKPPIGWEIKEGIMPNIVKKFVSDGNSYTIQIRDFITFFSRSEIKELLKDESFINEFVEESSSFMENSEVIDKSLVTIGTYPSITFKVKGEMEKSGITIPMIMRSWFIFYEDKIIILSASSLKTNEYEILEKVYLKITSSIVFPEQYN